MHDLKKTYYKLLREKQRSTRSERVHLSQVTCMSKKQRQTEPNREKSSREEDEEGKRFREANPREVKRLSRHNTVSACTHNTPSFLNLIGNPIKENPIKQKEPFQETQ